MHLKGGIIKREGWMREVQFPVVQMAEVAKVGQHKARSQKLHHTLSPWIHRLKNLDHFSLLSYQGAKSEIEWPGSKPMLIWAVGLIGGSFIHCTTMLAP